MFVGGLFVFVCAACQEVIDVVGVADASSGNHVLNLNQQRETPFLRVFNVFLCYRGLLIVSIGLIIQVHNKQQEASQQKRRDVSETLSEPTGDCSGAELLCLNTKSPKLLFCWSRTCSD